MVQRHKGWHAIYHTQSIAAGRPTYKPLPRRTVAYDAINMRLPSGTYPALKRPYYRLPCRTTNATKHRARHPSKGTSLKIMNKILIYTSQLSTPSRMMSRANNRCMYKKRGGCPEYGASTNLFCALDLDYDYCFE